MVYEVRLPELGDEAEEAAVVAWKVQEGETVEAGAVLCEVEAGKAVHEVVSPGNGTLRAILQEEGTLLAPGTLLAVSAQPSDDISPYQA